MPELPEVETVRRGLLKVMEGRVIARAQVNRPDLRWPLPERMADRLTGQRVLSLRRRSKYILADLSSGESLLIHLGMSGRMLVSGGMLGAFHHDHPAPEKHDHVVHRAAQYATDDDPQRARQPSELRGQHGPQQRSGAGDGGEVMAEQHEPVRLVVVVPIGQCDGGRRPIRIDADDLGGQEDAVLAVGQGEDAQGHENQRKRVHQTVSFAPCQGRSVVKPKAHSIHFKGWFA